MAPRPRVLVAMILEIWCRCVAHEQPRKRAIAPGYNAQLDASTAVKICGGCVLLELDGAQVMLNTVYEADARPPASDPVRIGAHEDTCIYFGCPNVDAAYTYLREKGLKLDPPKVAPYGMKQLYLHDPDGFALCFQWRTEKNLQGEV
jgi:hypothetical protein